MARRHSARVVLVHVGETPDTTARGLHALVIAFREEGIDAELETHPSSSLLPPTSWPRWPAAA
jgi:hypothetical protein